MNPPIGLRERKKLQTKEALITHAYKLFAKQGYNQTSIEDITRAANYSPRTFFLHFASKEDLLFPDVDVIAKSLEDALAARDAQTSALEALRPCILLLATYKHEKWQKGIDTKLQRQIIDSDRSLQVRERMYLSNLEALLAQELAKDLGALSTAVRPKIAAAAAIAMFSAVDKHGSKPTPIKEVEAQVSLVIRFLEAGLTATQ